MAPVLVACISKVPSQHQEIILRIAAKVFLHFNTLSYS